MAGKLSGVGAGIRDVARMAGVSPSTVSRVLNDRSGGVTISPATIERVRQAAEALRYQPNAAARSLRTTHTQTIGVIACDLLHPFSAELLRVVYAVCQARGYHLLVGHAEHDSAEGRVLGDILSADRVDGVLVVGDYLRGGNREKDMDRLVQTHGHVVSVGARPSVAGELAILVDDARGVALALEHLVSLGHRCIGYIRRRHLSVASEPWEDQQRCAAYRGFLSAAGLPHRPEAELLITNEIDQIEQVRQALRALLALPERPSAVFVNDDTTALITLKAALSCGIRVPEDLSVVGFDDLPSAALCTPGLTTVHQPIDAMGRYAVTCLLDRIGDVETALPTPDQSGAHIDARAEAPEEETTEAAPLAGRVGAHTVLFAPTLARRESSTALALTAPGDDTMQRVE